MNVKPFLLKRLQLVFLIIAVLFAAGCSARNTPVTFTPNDIAIETAKEAASDTPQARKTSAPVDESGTYTTKEDVAAYIHLYKKLPANFMTKKEARALGWAGGDLRPYAPGKCIGGDRFGNYEELLPSSKGRQYHECDIDTLDASSRGPKRIVFSNDGLIYYTGDHYKTFEKLYGGD